jgi:hypothetical protein
MSSPRLARWILSRLRRYDAEYRIRAEFEEEYRDVAVRRGAVPAGAWYWGQVLYALPAYLGLSVERGASMLKNYWKTALRQMGKHWGYTFINLAGLAGWSLARWALPLLNGLSGKVLTAPVFFQLGTIGITALLVLFIGVVAGGYPAFVLSGFAPAGILKRTLRQRLGRSGRLFRHDPVARTIRQPDHDRALDLRRDGPPDPGHRVAHRGFSNGQSRPGQPGRGALPRVNGLRI